MLRDYSHNLHIIIYAYLLFVILKYIMYLEEAIICILPLNLLIKKTHSRIRSIIRTNRQLHLVRRVAPDAALAHWLSYLIIDYYAVSSTKVVSIYL